MLQWLQIPFFQLLLIIAIITTRIFKNFPHICCNFIFFLQQQLQLLCVLLTNTKSTIITATIQNHKITILELSYYFFITLTLSISQALIQIIQQFNFICIPSIYSHYQIYIFNQYYFKQYYVILFVYFRPDVSSNILLFQLLTPKLNQILLVYFRPDTSFNILLLQFLITKLNKKVYYYNITCLQKNQWLNITVYIRSYTSYFTYIYFTIFQYGKTTIYQLHFSTIIIIILTNNNDNNQQL
eukprot:TRINITY_DN1793_c1_g1_i2.p1 TRINITY_DN1793_c1_g1~~TRINITY_DN1793_c1_g1_i2.p1  ORF type:complete len:241 (-),score=-27.43 TRINITY_DN1793_c1_g1_i2:339-1061(-)